MLYFTKLKQELDSIIARDPAARSRIEVFFCYPSFHALFFYHVSHWLWGKGWCLLARMLSGFARFFTCIEIHPGAQIGHGLFIDHGMGVVIGETSVIGNNVTIYQGVTLGGVSPSESSDQQRNHKRHPTLEDNVIVGSGAQILGDIVIGAHARIGSNAVVTHSVAPQQTVVGIPAKPVNVLIPKCVSRFCAYGIPVTGMTMDPIQLEIEALQKEIQSLKEQITHLKQNNQENQENPQQLRLINEETSQD